MVRVQRGDVWEKGVIVGEHPKPRSYMVETRGNVIRRNSRFLHKTKESVDSDVHENRDQCDISEEQPHVYSDQGATSANRSVNMPMSNVHDRVAMDTQSAPMPATPTPSVTTRSGRQVVRPARYSD